MLCSLHITALLCTTPQPCLYMIAHMWSQLPAVTKSSTTIAQFRARLNNQLISQGASVWTVYNFIYFYISIYSWASLYSGLVHFKLFSMHVLRVLGFSFFFNKSFLKNFPKITMYVIVRFFYICICIIHILSCFVFLVSRAFLTWASGLEDCANTSTLN